MQLADFISARNLLKYIMVRINTIYIRVTILNINQNFPEPISSRSPVQLSFSTCLSGLINVGGADYD